MRRRRSGERKREGVKLLGTKKRLSRVAYNLSTVTSAQTPMTSIISTP